MLDMVKLGMHLFCKQKTELKKQSGVFFLSVFRYIIACKQVFSFSFLFLTSFHFLLQISDVWLMQIPIAL